MNELISSDVSLLLMICRHIHDQRHFCETFLMSSSVLLLTAWQQHDVQELCRVMFDALERSWKNTDQANLITQLYQGKIKDYVKCLQVCRVFMLLFFPLNVCAHICVLSVFLDMCMYIHHQP